MGILVIATAVIIIYLIFAKKLTDTTKGKNRRKTSEKITRSGQQEPVRADNKLATSASPLDLTFGAPSSLPEQSIAVKSILSDKSYEVSLKNQTCTCEDFNTRKTAPKNHLSRCCKHLLAQLNAHGAFEDTDKWKKAIACSGYGGPTNGWIIQLENSPPVAAITCSSKKWINIYAHSVRTGEKIANASGLIKQYGWSILEQRWSYGESPPGARELKKILIEIEAIN